MKKEEIRKRAMGASIYPNGTCSLHSLVKKLESGDYILYFEEYKEEPKDWDWKKQGFYRGPQTEITSKEELIKALEKEVKKEGTICYDMKDSYYLHNVHEGEEKTYVKPTFTWQYRSPYGNKYGYKIRECVYLGEPPKHIPLSLDCYEGEFSDSCFTIGSWERDKEGYEFKSCGSRLFNYVDPKDLEVIFKAVKAADEYLNERFNNEEED